VSPAVFLVALLAGAAVLAAWLDTRFPRLAPRELRKRLIAAAFAFAFVAAAPISPEGGMVTLATLLGVFLPALCFALLTGLWLMRALSGSRA
jgi:hypothetical protein